MPLFSIVTVCFNESKKIKQCIDSVLNQTFKDYEYIVIDGQSTDGTVEFLKSVSQQLTYFESSSDNGIYNAMNKALYKTNGEYIYFLNANDYLHDDNVLKDAAEAIKRNSDIDVLHGKLAFTESDLPPKYKHDSNFTFSNINDFFSKNLPQQCFFFKKSLFNEIGFFNEEYTICADYHFTTKVILQKYNFYFMNRVLCVFDTTGISSTKSKERIKQKRKIIITISPTKVILKYILRGFLTAILPKEHIHHENK